MTATDDAYTPLAAALLEHTPSCAGDDRFVNDLQDATELEPICHTCPLQAPCHAFAAQTRPGGGIWAGRRWTRQTRQEAA